MRGIFHPLKVVVTSRAHALMWLTRASLAERGATGNFSNQVPLRPSSPRLTVFATAVVTVHEG